MWRDVRHPKNPSRLLFRFDPERDIIQVAERGEKFIIDLADHRDGVITICGIRIKVIEDPTMPKGQIQVIAPVG